MPSACADETSCQHNSDCTEGENGRCVQTRFGCFSVCSYDTCVSDADCGARQACNCRESATDSAPNYCLAHGNCRIDADCGTNGYCSPSLIGALCACTSVDYCKTLGDDSCVCSCGDSCGHDYFCHTPADECTDDSDCPSGTGCDFDLAHQNWICADCGPVP
jgi:hypothetical protein